MVLVVDDDADLVRIMGLVLDKAGVPYVAAHSLAEVEALDAHLHDITTALLDVNLGEGEPTGIDVAAWVHGHQPDARIVFMTGHASDHPLVRAAAGIDGAVLTKPINTERLIGVARG
jgi:CheY-like chemotaxis protein